MYVLQTQATPVLYDDAEYIWLPSEQRFVCTHREIERTRNSVYCYNCRNEDLTQEQVEALLYPEPEDEFDWSHDE